MIGLGKIDPENGLRPVIHKDQIDSRGDFFISLVPGYGLETVVDPFQGGTKAIRVIKIVNVTMALWADGALIAVRFRISLDLPDPVVFGIGENGAAVAASVAKGRHAGYGGIGLGLGPGFEIEQALAQGKGPGA